MKLHHKWQMVSALQVNYKVVKQIEFLQLYLSFSLWWQTWAPCDSLNRKKKFSAFVQYIQSYNGLVVISTVISANPHSKYSVHIFPSLLLIRVPNRKWSLGHFYPRGPDQRSAYLRHTGYVPRLRKELQTGSCPSISAKYRMKSPEDFKWVKLWGSGAGPTSISYLCRWPGVEGKFSIEYCIQLSGSSGSCILCGYSFLRLAMRPVSSPSVLFLAFLRSGPSAVCCGSHLHTCHEKTAVVRHNIISAAEREGKACVAVPPSVYSPEEFNSRASVQWTNIFTIKTCRIRTPPPWALTAGTCNTITAKPVGEQGC